MGEFWVQAPPNIIRGYLLFYPVRAVNPPPLLKGWKPWVHSSPFRGRELLGCWPEAVNYQCICPPLFSQGKRSYTSKECAFIRGGGGSSFIKVICPLSTFTYLKHIKIDYILTHLSSIPLLWVLSRPLVECQNNGGPSPSRATILYLVYPWLVWVFGMYYLSFVPGYYQLPSESDHPERDNNRLASLHHVR